MSLVSVMSALVVSSKELKEQKVVLRGDHVQAS